MFDSIPAGENLFCDGVQTLTFRAPELLPGLSRAHRARGGSAWKSVFPGPPTAWLEISSECHIHHPQIVRQPPGQREQPAASVPPRWGRDDGLPRTGLLPNFSPPVSQGAEESCNLPRSVKPCLTSTPTSICVLLETLGRRWNKDGTNGFNSTGLSVPLVTQPIYSSAVLRCPCGPIRQRYHLLKAAHDEATCLCCNQGDVQRMRVKDSCARRWRSRSLPGASTRGWWEQPTLEED
ncbi:uncharacterized protein LOC141917851 [Strix aluco]|uniref:uncharacterized protein LOC141917851 n=1 Tax=Strix aluco TaxID=111821 RepID=UPI003DA33583